MNQLTQSLGSAPKTLSELDDVFSEVLSIAIGLAGIGLFVMLVSGGFKYLTSGGDPKRIEAAKNTLTYAIGGFILLLLSYFIIVFIENITGTKLTNFSIIK